MVDDMTVFFSEIFPLHPKKRYSDSAGFLFFSFQHKGSSLAKDYEQSERYNFPTKSPSHKENTTCL